MATLLPTAELTSGMLIGMRRNFRSERLPPGPADAKYPTRVLARLAVAQAAASLAEQAARLVDLGDRESTVDACRQIQSAVQKLTELAVIQDFEDRVPITRNGEQVEPLGDEEWGPLIYDWYHKVERPWAWKGQNEVQSRLPNGLEDPHAAALRLDKWVKNHRNINGDSHISDQLAEHDLASEAGSLDRHLAYLNAPDTKPSQAEVNAHNIRQARFTKKHTRQEQQGFIGYDDVPSEVRPSIVRELWWQILNDVRRQHPKLDTPLSWTKLYRAHKDVIIVIGHPLPDRLNLLYSLVETFEESIQEITGVAGVQVRIPDPETAQKLDDEESK
ncbi:hypothetical protein [Mycobacteroides abscessus]|uniref:hypothetical protein n=1 Tax=Mycobacteroides abscessus TaxID=36809 RepID=UPI0010422D47|nr:hypothetical protein [Mycobacteroides abscessus]MDM2350560.1 hypothetical protein [Mycobacteroides abscessus]MDM2357819.1 hypothetical protein [Mycobacteroides abscessus]QSN50894.1 hypothetical protein I3U39_19110 [Mycobacteroides abscessus subsp. abscessus]